ncbi:MAG: site-2 protease family protein [Anaerolineae bacterium]
MRSGFSIGRLFGISVRIDWSWLFIFILVTWNLATVFGQLHADWGVALQWGLAALAAVLFFASVLAHELAHSLVARSRGIPVRSITLFLFGGVSNIQREPASPAGEFFMAVVGPLTSLIVGAALLVVASAGGLMSGGLLDPSGLIARTNPIPTLVLWLGSVNILVGLFNLIPGFPLDGGRILRSILWALTKSLRTATRWATWVGQAIAWLFIVGGIAMAFGVTIPVFGSGFINGLWLAFIGWFLNSASAQSYQQMVVRDILEGVCVKDIMRTNPQTIPSIATINDLVHERVMASDDYAFPVVDDDRLMGIVTLDDVRGRPRSTWDETLVRDIMTPAGDMVVARPDEDAADAMDRLVQRDVRQLPVLDNGALVGLLRRRDLMRYLQLQGGDNARREG